MNKIHRILRIALWTAIGFLLFLGCMQFLFPYLRLSYIFERGIPTVLILFLFDLWWSFRQTKNRLYPRWLKAGLLGIIIIVGLPGLLWPVVYFCDLINLHLRCYYAVSGLSSLLAWTDIFAWIACRGICQGEEGMVRIITAVPSAFLVGVIINWLCAAGRRFRKA